MLIVLAEKDEYKTLSSSYNSDKFFNLFIRSLGIFGQSCSTFTDMLEDLAVEKSHNRYIYLGLSKVIIRFT